LLSPFGTIERSKNITLMANTYTQIHIHGVFVVKFRDCIIDRTWEDELYKYITGIIRQNNHKLIAIKGTSNHVHILFGFRPTQSLSDLMQDIKGSSSKWINEKRFVRGKFAWQEGYGAFSYSKTDLSTVIHYIDQQNEHHKKITFTEEYKKLLKEFEVDYEEKYIFNDV
jgi:putative transposase